MSSVTTRGVVVAKLPRTHRASVSPKEKVGKRRRLKLARRKAVSTDGY